MKNEQKKTEKKLKKININEDWIDVLTKCLNNSGGKADVTTTNNDGAKTKKRYFFSDNLSCFFTKNNLDICAIMASEIAV